jgi:endonuclease/exonuclease/phosphatase family metal-dependent hydrolase
VPQIVCGDMNTENEMKEHYCEMLSCLDAEDGEFSSLEKETYDGVNNDIAKSYGAKKKFSLDYILLRANGAKVKSVKRTVSVLRKGKKYLSDHYGVVCELKF